MEMDNSNQTKPLIEGTSPKSSISNQKGSFLIILGVIFVISIVGIGAYLLGSNKTNTDFNQQAKSSPTQTSVNNQLNKPLPSVEEQGNTSPVNKIAILKDKGIALINPDGTGLTQIYTPADSYVSGMVWSPNGKLLVASIGNNMFSETGNDLSLVLVDVATKKVDVLVSNAGYHSLPSWSPDSKIFVYNANGTLKLVNIQTKASTDLTDDAFTFPTTSTDNIPKYYNPIAPVWSVKNQIFYLQTVGQNVSAGEKRLAVISSDGNKKVLVPNKDIHIYGAMAVSSDGTKIAYGENDKGYVSSKGIWIVNADGTNDRQLIKDSIPYSDFQWSANGKFLLGTGGLGGIFVVDTQTGKVDSLPSGVPGGWSPDGEQIVYTAQIPNVQKGGEIKIYNLNTKSSTRISESFSSQWVVAWSSK